MSSNCNTREYRTIVQCASELVTALKNDLDTLIDELSAASLITTGNAVELKTKLLEAGKVEQDN